MMPHVTQADCSAAEQLARIIPHSLPWDWSKVNQAFTAHRLAAIAEERARVVAYLRTRLIANVGDRFADAIERGDHIQEK